MNDINALLQGSFGRKTFSQFKIILNFCSLPWTCCTFQMFAFGLNNLFELLEVNEDCYGVGYLSKVIATELANLPAARMRRKVNQGEDRT